MLGASFWEAGMRVPRRRSRKLRKRIVRIYVSAIDESFLCID
jgi:hypothetical protein